jgi:hypothetical protein
MGNKWMPSDPPASNNDSSDGDAGFTGNKNSIQRAASAAPRGAA